MPKFILIRHGETVDNVGGYIQGWRGSELTKLGHQQAQQLIDTLTVKPDLIFSSDLHRCLQTAQYIHDKYADIPLLHDWRLRERSFGPKDGQASDSMNWDEFWAHSELESYNGAEPEAFFAERIKSFVRDTHIFAADTIMVVTHGGVLNRFGFIFDENHEATKYPNTAVVEYDIDYTDERLNQVHRLTWRPK